MPGGTWWWSERRSGATVAFTRRDGGRSGDPWSGLNLAGHVGDDTSDVLHNRALVARALTELAGVEPARLQQVFMNQVHGAQVRVITTPEQLVEPTPEADAVVTTLADVALFSLVADCAPVLLHDDGAGVIAAAHAGRPGMLAGVVPATLAAMRDLGAGEIHAVVGPSVCGRCYEVPEQMRDEAIATEPVSGAVTWRGTPAIDVASGVVEQLRREGADVTWVRGCTREEPALYSYRRDGQTGRLAGVVVRSAPPGGTPERGARVR